MAKSNKMQSISDARRRANHPHKLPSWGTKSYRSVRHPNKHIITASEKKEWNDAICSVCMEYPHNAVLLLCSSYENGCRPYMCETSHRYSNCLKQYKKAYANTSLGFPEDSNCFSMKSQLPELICPLCRGQVKGWTVVERARTYLNAKKRNCTQDKCSFAGTYEQLRRHVRLEHPLSCPRQVDPTRAEKWKKLESERELNDVYSTIMSTMPGAVVIGDYVIERNDPFVDDPLFIPRFSEVRWVDPVFSPDDDEGYDSIEEEYARRRARRRIVGRRGRFFAATRAGRLRRRRIVW